MSPSASPAQHGSPSATAAAASAASGHHGKAKRPTLQTPLCASYPSEIQTPLSATPTQSRRVDESVQGKATPISPPVAYTDFLKAVSPSLISPPTAESPRSRLPSSESAASPDKKDGGESASQSGIAADDAPPQPPISRNPSSDSATSFSSFSSFGSTNTSTSTGSQSSISATAGPGKHKPQSPRITIPPSGGARSSSARTPRKLYIPGSPLSGSAMRTPGSARALMSARGLASPWSSTIGSPLATSTTVTTRSPRLLHAVKDRPDTPCEDGHSLVPVYVREVVTRTVTYACSPTPSAPLAAAPRGKRRKTVSDDGKDADAGPVEGDPPSEAQSAKENFVKEESVP